MDRGTQGPPSHDAIRTLDLTKSYGAITALDGCSLNVAPGEIFGLLGPNGAGKSTLIRLLLGFLRPTRGRASVGGLDCIRQSLAVRRQVAYLPGDPRLFRHINGWQTTRFFRQVRGGWDRIPVARLAERLELDLSRRVAAMSTGMRQKLALLVTFLADAPILILDEPTSNLDPTARREVLQLVREAGEAGKTVLFSSHVLAEVEQVCGRVAILRGGKLARQARMADIHRAHRIRLQLPPQHGPLHIPEPLQAVVRTRRDGDEVWLETEAELASLLHWIASLEPVELHIEPVGLQAVYDQVHPPHESSLS